MPHPCPSPLLEAAPSYVWATRGGKGRGRGDRFKEDGRPVPVAHWTRRRDREASGRLVLKRRLPPLSAHGYDNDMARLLLVSNRLPVTVKLEHQRVSVQPSAGGLASGLSA